MVKWEDAMDSRFKFDSDNMEHKKLLEKIQKSKLPLPKKSLYIKKIQKIQNEDVVKRLEELDLENITSFLDKMKV